MKKSMLLKVCLLMTMAVLTVTGCGRYKDIKVTSYKINSYKFEGLRAVNLDLALEVDNPAGKVKVLELGADVKYSGKVIGRVDIAPFELAPRQKLVHNLNVRASFANGFGVRDLLSLIDMKDLMAAIKKKNAMELLNPKFINELTADINLVGKAAGVKINRTISDVPLKKLLGK